MNTQEEAQKVTESSKKELLSTPVAIIVGSIIVSIGLMVGLSIGSGSGSDQGNPWKNITASLKINEKKFEACLTSGKYVAKVEADTNSGRNAGVNGTPHTFIISKDGTQYRVNGAQPTAIVQALVENALVGKPSADEQVTLPPVSESDHILGDVNAEITIIEYSDLECPFCARFQETKNAIIAQYPGKVRWVMRHFPLSDIHPNAKTYAYAAECANELQGNDAYWSMVDYIFKNQPLKK